MNTATSNGYESSPACLMLATNCAACGRPLVDAVSVEAAMGPDCREKYGCCGDLAEDVRAEANKLVATIAIQQTGFDVAAAAARLAEMGLPRLAARVLKRAAPIQITEVEGGRLAVKTPYSPEAVDAFRRIAGRRWDGESKLNTFPPAARPALWETLRALFRGTVGIGPKGAFTL